MRGSGKWFLCGTDILKSFTKYLEPDQEPKHRLWNLPWENPTRMESGNYQEMIGCYFGGVRCPPTLGKAHCLAQLTFSLALLHLKCISCFWDYKPHYKTLIFPGIEGTWEFQVSTKGWTDLIYRLYISRILVDVCVGGCQPFFCLFHLSNSYELLGLCQCTFPTLLTWFL